MMTPPPRHDVAPILLTHPHVCASQPVRGVTPASTVLTASLVHFSPIALLEPFTVAKAWWCNGATVGTNSVDIGMYRMTDMATGRLDLIRSTGAVLSAGSANVVQETATWKVAANKTSITTGADGTDASAYTTASVTLKAGRLYLMTVVNTAASAAVVSSIVGGPTWSAAPATSTTQYNGTAHRVSIWSGVPTVDYTGTIAINFGSTQTGARWSLNEFSGVDTATTNGIVQAAVGTGNSTTPLATLAAFGSANNATFGANANTADNTTTPGAGFTELSDDTTATVPASFLQTQWRVDNDTTSDGTITSGQWGAVAVEIKADASAFIINPGAPGRPDLYWAFTCNGGTATFFTQTFASAGDPGGMGCMRLTSTFPLPSTCTPVAFGNATAVIPFGGFSSRTLIG